MARMSASVFLAFRFHGNFYHSYRGDTPDELGFGKDIRYATADTGLGNFMAVKMSASGHIKRYAPSYNGNIQEFRLLLAPYLGDSPPQAIQDDAKAFAYPYLVLNDDSTIASPPHRRSTDF
jgi:hypothetical protein